MKRYCVRVEYSGFKKVWVEAEDEDEAMDLATDEVVAKIYDTVNLDDIYDWEIDAVEVEENEEE